MKNIVVFTYGDAENPSTWSNVPYMFTTTLKKRGYNVINVDISTRQNILALIYSLICKILKPTTTFYFYRSKTNRKIVEKKIQKAVKAYDDIADLYISISFDFSPSQYTDKKVLLLSDWPIEYAIEKRFNRTADFLEKKDIERHKKVIESATYRISLFQDVAAYMNERFEKPTQYFGGLINGLCDIEGFEETENRDSITFIGKKAYIESAQEVITAFENLDKNLVESKNLKLQIVGMTRKDFKNIKNARICFHGYLSKGKKDEYQKYYEVIRRSLVLVNTSEKWAGMSSILEAMYYYRPIITSRYEEFAKTFGEEINFGFYSTNNSKEIKKHIENILNLEDEQYVELTKNANSAVKEFTYDAFISKIEKTTDLL